MKRLLAIAAVLLVLAPCATAGASTTLKSELLPLKVFPAHWAKYGIAPVDTRTCPESSFKGRKGPSLARVALVDRGSETIYLEQLQHSKSPAKAFAAEVRIATACPKKGTEFNNTTVFQTTHPVSLGHFSVPVRVFGLTATVGSAKVTACVVYALKGRVVIDVAEISLGSLNLRSFKGLVQRAIARVSS